MYDGIREMWPPLMEDCVEGLAGRGLLRGMAWVEGEADNERSDDGWSNERRRDGRREKREEGVAATRSDRVSEDNARFRLGGC